MDDIFDSSDFDEQLSGDGTAEPSGGADGDPRGGADRVAGSGDETHASKQEAGAYGSGTESGSRFYASGRPDGAAGDPDYAGGPAPDGDEEDFTAKPYRSAYDSYRFQTPVDVPVYQVNTPGKKRGWIKVLVAILAVAAAVVLAGYFGYRAVTGRSPIRDLKRTITMWQSPGEGGGPEGEVTLGAPNPNRHTESAQADAAGAADSGAQDAAAGNEAAGGAAQSGGDTSAAGGAAGQTGASGSTGGQEEAAAENADHAAGRKDKASGAADSAAGQEEKASGAAGSAAGQEEAVTEAAGNAAGQEEAVTENTDHVAGQEEEVSEAADNTAEQAAGSAAGAASASGDAAQTENAAGDKGAYIGITCMTMPEAYTMNGYPSGVYVMDVNENGPAEQAGIAEGDILTAIDGTELFTKEELIEALTRYAAGDSVTVNVSRYSKDRDAFDELTAQVTLGDRKDMPADGKSAEPAPAEASSEGTAAESTDTVSGETAAESTDTVSGETTAESTDAASGETAAESTDAVSGETAAESTDAASGETEAENTDTASGDSAAESADGASGQAPEEKEKIGGASEQGSGERTNPSRKEDIRLGAGKSSGRTAGRDSDAADGEKTGGAAKGVSGIPGGNYT